jgi:predicted ATPase
MVTSSKFNTNDQDKEFMEIEGSLSQMRDEVTLTDTDRFFIVTGGPGSGKSTLIEALAVAGLQCMPEAGRAIIQQQVASGGSALPWDNRLAFAQLMFRWDVHSWRAARLRQGPVFFDRGVPDVVGYLQLIGLPVPGHIEEAARIFRYHPRVFVAPPWPAIYAQDAERKQSIKDAEATYCALVNVYSDLGYELVPLPLATVAERVGFVRRMIC